MKWFFDRSTGTKFLSVCGFLIVLWAVTLAIAITGLNRAEAEVAELAKVTIERVRQAEEIKFQFHRYRTRHLRAVIEGAGKGREGALKDLDASRTEIDAAFAAFGQERLSVAEHEALDVARLSWWDYQAADIPWMADLRAGRFGSLREHLAKVERPLARETVEPALEALAETTDASAHTMAEVAAAQVRTTKTGVLLIAIVASAVAIVVALLVTRQVCGLIRGVSERIDLMSRFGVPKLHDAMLAMSRYDLTGETGWKTQEMPVRYRDDVSQMAGRLNVLIQNLRETVGAFRTVQVNLSGIVSELGTASGQLHNAGEGLLASTEQEASAASEIAQGSEKLAQTSTETAQEVEGILRAVRSVGERADQQVVTLEAAASALEAVTTTAGRVAEEAGGAGEAATEGRRRVADLAGANAAIQDQVERSSEQVARLDEAGKQIGAIVSSIEQIAEQTNLLALNAAIEAARAGEHGRGFAVVAEEVRKLAEQAGGATREISDLIAGVRTTVGETVRAIGETVPLVQQSTHMGEEADRALARISETIAQVGKDAHSVAEQGRLAGTSLVRVRDMARGTVEETVRAAEGTERVTGAVQSVAAVSEETAAGAQELSASAAEVQNAAERVSEMAEELHAMVSRFRTAEETATPELKLAA